MPATPTITYAQLKKDIKARKLSSIYLLHGEESYFVDELTKLFENVVSEENKDFDQHILYGTQTPLDVVGATSMRYPMFSDRLVVICKEFQNVNKNEYSKLIPYLAKPNEMSTLVLVSRGAKVEQKGLTDAIKKAGGVIFESKKIYENKMPQFVKELANDMGLNIEAEGISIIVDNIGTNLAKVSNEMEKLAMILGPNAMVTPEAIELNVGISREFNNRELVDAVARKDFPKCMRILDYFKRNPKSNPAIVTAATLFSFFSTLMVGQFSGEKSKSGLMNAMEIKWDVQFIPYEHALRNYNAWKTIEIISEIRDFDAKAKGMGSRQNEYALLQELIYKILLAKGSLNY